MNNYKSNFMIECGVNKMKIYKIKVPWEGYDTEIAKVLERKYPGAKVMMMNENIQGTGGDGGTHVTTWEGEWNGEKVRFVFKATKGEEIPKR